MQGQTRHHRHQALQVRGAVAYAASGDARSDLSELQPINSLPGGTTYLMEIVIAADATVTSAAVGGTLGELKSQDLIELIRLVWPGHRDPVALPAGAGSALYAHERLTTGRKPKGVATVIIGGATGALRNRYRIRFWQRGAKGELDYGCPIALLRSASLNLRWANGAAGVWLNADHSVTAGAISVTATLIERPDFRIPSQFAIESQTLAGLDERLPVEGRVLRALAEIPTQAAGAIATTPITAANRVLVTVELEGRRVVDGVRADDAIEQWNGNVCETYAERITDHPLNTSELVPLIYPIGRDRATYDHWCQAKPRYLATGTTATPRVIYETSSMLSLGDVVLDAQTAGALPIRLAAPAERYLELVTDGGVVPWPTGLGATRLPVRVRRTPR